MHDPVSDQIDAERLLEDDIVRILMKQHLQIRELCAAMAVAMSTEQKTVVFDELRELLAIHEAAEEVVLRPTTLITAGEAVVDQRNAEEKAAAAALAELENLSIATVEFDEKFADFAKSMAAHTEAEEVEEFARLLVTSSDRERSRLGDLLLQVEKMAPLRPRPALAGSPVKQMVIGPFASLLDHAKDLITRAVE